MMFQKYIIFSFAISFLTACDSNLENIDSQPSTELDREISTSNPLSTIAGNPLITNLLVYQNDEFIFDLQSAPASTHFLNQDMISLEAVFDDRVEISSVQYFIEARKFPTSTLRRWEVSASFNALILSRFATYRFTVVATSNIGESERSTPWIVNESAYSLHQQDPNPWLENVSVIGGEQ